MNQPTLKEVLLAYDIKGYPKYLDRDFDLNLFGVRTGIPDHRGDIQQYDKFDDFVGCIWRENGRIKYFVCPATTDPGLHYLTYPINPKGTAIMVPGHYKGLWIRGRHKTYSAFRQNRPVKVFRDRNRDKYLDVTESDSRVEEGMFYINLHRAHSSSILSKIGRYSAGCQVIQNPMDFNLLRDLGDKQIQSIGANSFSYSLFTENDF